MILHLLSTSISLVRQDLYIWVTLYQAPRGIIIDTIFKLILMLSVIYLIVKGHDLLYLERSKTNLAFINSTLVTTGFHFDSFKRSDPFTLR